MKIKDILIIILLMLASTGSVLFTLKNIKDIKVYRENTTLFGKDLLSGNEKATYVSSTSSNIYFEKTTVEHNDKSVELYSENHSLIFSFDDKFYKGNYSEIGKKCDAILINRKFEEKENIYLSGINCN